MNTQIETIIAAAQKTATWLAYRRAARQILDMTCPGDSIFKAQVKVAVAGSFTVDPLVDFLRVEAAACSIGIDAYGTPYGQDSQDLLNPESRLYQFTPDLTVLIVEPPSLADHPVAAADELLKRVRAWMQHAVGTLVLCSFIAEADWPLHILPTQQRLQRISANTQLREAFKDEPRVQVCDLDALAAYFGYANAFSPEMAAMARVPFSEGFLALLAQKLVSHLKVHCQLIRKCLVLDCDNTLWGGIVGEDGIDGIRIGPDWPGREFLEFQKAILELYEQGVILAVNSKNNEADVMAVLRDHPHMLLRESHFAAIAANWDSKPVNMKKIADEINIGTDTFVFVDDNPAERAMMAQMRPEVAVLELPANPAYYAKTLRQTHYFAKASLTEEDKKRGQIYAAQRQRSQLKESVATLQDYLKSLEMACSIRLAEEKDIKRAAQLTQRTNQFNLTTRRYSESDVQQMLENPNWKAYVLGLKDKFGDNGTVGLALVEKQSGCWRIDTFLMSCRVIGRQAEDALVDAICRDAVSAGIVKLTGEYIRTSKNGLVEDFWQKMNFTQAACDGTGACYYYDLSQYQPKNFEYLAIE